MESSSKKYFYVTCEIRISDKIESITDTAALCVASKNNSSVDALRVMRSHQVYSCPTVLIWYEHTIHKYHTLSLLHRASSVPRPALHSLSDRGSSLNLTVCTAINITDD